MLWASLRPPVSLLPWPRRLVTLPAVGPVGLCALHDPVLVPTYTPGQIPVERYIGLPEPDEEEEEDDEDDAFLFFKQGSVETEAFPHLEEFLPGQVRAAASRGSAGWLRRVGLSRAAASASLCRSWKSFLMRYSTA